MEDKAYEMLWDCEYCGAKKLLGKTHRFCPGCGAAQNTDKRYFPSDADKVLAKDHEYFGADKVCPACKTAVSARMKFCAKCGSAMDAASSVKRVGEAPEAPAAAAAAPGTSGQKSFFSAVVMGLAVLVFVGIAGSMVLRSCSKGAVLTASGHKWARQVAVDRYETVNESEWCEDMSPDAYNVSRRSEVKDHKDVADGQDCKTVKKDQGDGTFVEKEECSTRYRKEEVYADKCRYSVDRWKTVRTEKKSGDKLSDDPVWPAVSLQRPGDCRGCEREGARTETYTVVLTADAKSYECAMKSWEAWRNFALGSRWQGKVKMLGGLDCEALAPAK